MSHYIKKENTMVILQQHIIYMNILTSFGLKVSEPIKYWIRFPSSIMAAYSSHSQQHFNAQNS